MEDIKCAILFWHSLDLASWPVALPVASANAEDTVVIKKKIGITIATGTDTTIVTGIGITTRKL